MDPNEQSAANDTTEADGVDCEDGLDETTAAVCDGGVQTNPTDSTTGSTTASSQN